MEAIVTIAGIALVGLLWRVAERADEAELESLMARRRRVEHRNEEARRTEQSLDIPL